MFLHKFVLLPMIIVIPKESTADERRVAIAPDNVAAFTKLGYEVHVEAGAGVSAEMPDELYKEEELRLLMERNYLAVRRFDTQGQSSHF